MAQSRVIEEHNERWHIFTDTDAVREEVTRRLAQTAAAAIGRSGAFHVALAGGRTPAAIYAQLARQALDWSRWFIYFGDERCLPRGHAERNDTMVHNQWLDHVAIPIDQVFAMPAELGAEDGAANYRRTLALAPTFDLVLLGLGEDGHTASLFPGHPRNGEAVLPVHDAPKPPPDRISLSAPRLSDAHAVWFVVTGEDKRAALERWRRGDDIPARAVRPDAGVDIFTDVDVVA